MIVDPASMLMFIFAISSAVSVVAVIPVTEEQNVNCRHEFTRHNTCQMYYFDLKVKTKTSELFSK